MTSPRADWSAVRALFDDLIDRSPVERERRLARASLPDGLAREVRGLLAAAEQAGDFLERPMTVAADAGPGEAPYSSLQPGAPVGPFRIVGLIGRGGQGEVYRAVRADGQFDQTVALKLLRPEAAAQFERFRTERQILAGLEHPGIARLIDGGTAPDGRPYLAMEFVEGESITAHADAAALGLGARLALVREVCAAVAYAHRNLVVHRDLKPANVLVTPDGSTKLLDFGIARILADADGGTLTEAILTPDYAAPEQFEGRRATTATDVYALGAILFELLTGRPPWTGGGAFPGAARLLQDEPPRASRSVRGQGLRALSPRALEGDLDAIVAKAMRHEPGDRYESVVALSDDIGRHLALRPVRAREGDLGYRLRRFVRRNRARLAAGTVTTATVAIGAAAFAWQRGRTGRERAVAREAGARASAVREYLMLMLRTAGEAGGPGFATAKQVLDSTAARLADETGESAAGEPSGSQRMLLRILGELYVEMDDFVAAAPLLERCAALARQAGDEAGLAEARQSLATVAIRRGQLDGAERELRAAKDFWSIDRPRFARQRAEAAGVEAGLLRERGQRAEALSLLRSALSESVTLLGPDSEAVATLQHNVGVHLLDIGRLDEADAALSETWRMLVAQGRTRSALSIGVKNHRAGLAFRRGRVAEAEQMWRDAIAMRRELYGPSTALAALSTNLARLLLVQERQVEALPIIEDSLAVALAFAGDGSSVTIILRQSRALALTLVDRVPEAMAEIEHALAAAAEAFGARHLYQAFGLSVRAQVHMFSGDLAAARQDVVVSRSILAEGGPSSAQHLAELDSLGAILDGLDPPGDAAQLSSVSSR